MRVIWILVDWLYFALLIKHYVNIMNFHIKIWYQAIIRPVTLYLDRTKI